MLSTVQGRRVRGEFDLESGRLFLPEGLELAPKDVLQDEKEAEIVVGIFPLRENPRIPSTILTIGRRPAGRISISNYILAKQSNREYLIRISPRFILESQHSAHIFYDGILREAGQ